MFGLLKIKPNHAKSLADSLRITPAQIQHLHHRAPKRLSQGIRLSIGAQGH